MKLREIAGNFSQSMREIATTESAPTEALHPPAPAEDNWRLEPNIRQDMLAGVCARLEQAGYQIVAVIPAGAGPGGAWASVLGRKR